MQDRYLYIYGKHAVMEALTHRPDVVTHVYVRDDQKQQLRSQMSQQIRVSTFSGNNVPQGVDPKAVHQGVIAQIDRTKLVLNYDTFIRSYVVANDSALAILGELTDPHNVGAVIRSAAAFGFSAVLIPKHRQAGLTGTVVKVSAGMAFRIPLVEVGNVNRTLEDCKKRGFFTYALAGDGQTQLDQEDFSKPSVFVLGNEGEGVREKTREHCDTLLRIATHARCESLNASASAAVVFYQWSVQHPQALQ